MDRRLRHRAAGVSVAYLAMVLALPWLHLQHHLLHGADHTHGAGGMVVASGVAVEVDDSVEHIDFDRTLADLDLADVFAAGSDSVDCGYSAYTLVEACAAPQRMGHAIAFGDRVNHRHASDVDPLHGQHAPEHGSVLLVASCPLHAPPPPSSLRQPLPPSVEQSLCSRNVAQVGCRGPPSV